MRVGEFDDILEPLDRDRNRKDRTEKGENEQRLDLRRAAQKGFAIQRLHNKILPKRPVEQTLVKTFLYGPCVGSLSRAVTRR